MNTKIKELDIHLGTAALVLGLFIFMGLRSVNHTESTVTVRGLCEREVMADRAIYPICYKEAGDDLERLYATVQKKNEIIRQFLNQQGFSNDEISVGTPTLTDRYADSYSSYQSRYTINSTVSLCTDKVEQVIALQSNLSQLLSKGIAIGSGNAWDNPVVYELTKLNDLKPTMIESANKNAHTSAEQFATDSHSRLGKIKTATQGLFSIENRDINTPYIKRVRVVTNVTYRLH